MTTTTFAKDHSPGCGWHFEQYPKECDCGSIVGTRGEITVDRQLFYAMYATLLHKQITFDHYSMMHSAKGNSDGIRKAVANKAHADEMRKVLDRVRSELDRPEERGR